jgi:hypothetical protein
MKSVLIVLILLAVACGFGAGFAPGYAATNKVVLQIEGMT